MYMAFDPKVPSCRRRRYSRKKKERRKKKEAKAVEPQWHKFSLEVDMDAEPDASSETSSDTSQDGCADSSIGHAMLSLGSFMGGA